MRKSRFTDEQIIKALKEHAAGLSANELCRKYGVSDATFYKWRSRYGGMEISDARKLKALEDENRRLKKLLAESMLDASTLKEMLGRSLTPSFRKRAVTWAVREKGYSQRRACGLVGLHPKTYRYASKRPLDEGLRRQLRELASQRRRFGYRRLGLMLERQGIKLNRKCCHCRCLLAGYSRATVASAQSASTPRGGACGSQTLTVVPTPSSLSICSWPRWRLTTCLTMARPSPVPPAARERPASTR